MKKEFFDPPEYGWKVRLDYQFPQRRTQKRMLNLTQLRPMLMLVIRIPNKIKSDIFHPWITAIYYNNIGYPRVENVTFKLIWDFPYILYNDGYIIQYLKDWWNGKTPIMDYVYPASCDQQSGVPLGGIGSGTIGRGFRGEFSRFQMIPGVYEFPSTTVDTAQFILNIQDISNNTLYQKVLTCQRKPKSKLSSWEWDFPAENAEYTALYPRSWTVFNIPEQKIKLICRQISPFIPNNYKDSCIPGAVFVWNIINYNEGPRKISITFTFESGIGFKHDNSENIQIKDFNIESKKSSIHGVSIKQVVNQQPLTYCLGALKKEDTHLTSMIFDPNGDGKTIWAKLQKNGELESCPFLPGKKKLASGLCARTTVHPNDSSKVVFSLAWDNPIVKFPLAGTIKKKFYTKYFGGISGDSGPDICLYCIDNFEEWEKSIEEWQTPILENINLPDWYKSALFNELYYISDGGSIWLLADEEENLPARDPRVEYGRFCYLEGHEYRMCNTYDVHYYASAALISLWPKLQLSLQYDIRDAIPLEDKTDCWFLYNGEHGYRKYENSVPHDLGDPKENPFVLLNSYNIHDVSNWKDLGLKFVLQVYRDYTVTSDIKYVQDMFPKALIVMNHALSWITEDDGMIRNDGRPDQTYDAWTMSGISSYCGSLWIASLVVFIRIAELVKENTVAKEFCDILSKAKVTFNQKLWNGEYYCFDSSGSEHSDSIMADQLCGLWYLHSCGIEDEIFPSENVKQALSVIYKMNVCNYFNGHQGAVNGMRPNGKVDTSAIQSEEVWTGVTYALASLLIFEGFIEEGLLTAKGLYETIYEKSGLGFATPEGIFRANGFRALSYMRPLSVWSMQLALDKQKKLFDKNLTVTVH